MPWRSSTLGQVEDGQAAWDQFISGVQRTFETNAGMVPLVIVVVIVLTILWLDFRMAKILVGRGGKRRGSKRKQTHSS